MNKAIPLTALALAAGVSTNVYAQTSQTTELEPIIVSGGISPVAADEFGRSNTVITRRDIEDSGYATVQQALEAQPGVSINGTGPNDRQIRIRGGEGNHTLVLIDGVRAASGDNEFFLRGLDTSYIQRIEILRGPQSVPYGTDAATGVVNIITREAGEGVGFGASAEFGEGDRQSAYVTRGTESGKLSLSVSNLNDEGYDFSGSGGEKDGTRWKSLNTKGSVDLTARTTAGFSFRFADAKYDFDDTDDYIEYQGFVSSQGADSVDGYVLDDPGKQRNLTERAGRIYLKHRTTDQTISHRLRFDRTANQTDNDFASDTTTEVGQYRYQIALDRKRIESSDQLLSVLLERRVDGDEGEVQDRENDSFGLEYQTWLSDALSVQAGLRYDDNNLFEDATTWNVAGSYFLDNGVRLHASGGRAVVNPSFFEFTGGTDEAYNSDLEAERNLGFDIGFEAPLAGINGSTDITVFRDVLEDEIFSDDLSSAPYDYENRNGDSDRQGAELTLSAHPVEGLDLQASYTYLDATNSEGQRVTRRPRNELGASAEWRLPNAATTLSSDVRYVEGLVGKEFWKDGSPRAELPAFTVVNLAAQHALTEHVDLTARVTNAFDEDYQEVWGFATRGRAAFVGVRTSW
ncbi:TonB-dependent receptor [Spiribacter sp. 1M153]|uniref:TonB-dependent receptor plug domain-containing protein n=1 Tax=Spiribacter roseus TaxID=1855875 RepID=UPI00349FAE5B